MRSIASAAHGAKRDAGMLLLPTSRPARREGYWLWLLVVLVAVAAARPEVVNQGFNRLLGLPPEPLGWWFTVV